MAMSTFNTVRITQLNEEISTLKEKTDLILDVVHLHEKHLHHVEEKLEQTNFWPTFWKPMSGSPPR
jgi:hypothetical protein